jgi:hypothetical protein
MKKLLFSVLLLSSCYQKKCIKTHKEILNLYNYYGTNENDLVTVFICDSSITIK